MRRHAKAPPLAGTTSTGTRTAGAFGRFSLAILGALCMALLIAAAPASAEPTWVTSFGEPAEELVVNRLDVNEETGDVYVINANTQVVDRFSSSGTLLGELTGTGQPIASLGIGGWADDIAVDNTGGSHQGWVYLIGEQGGGPGVVTAFNAAGVAQWQVQPNSYPKDICGVAVDPTGALWIADYFNGIRQLATADGSEVGGFVAATSGEPCQIAFDGSGNLYSTQWSNAVHKYTPPIEDPPTSTLDAETNIDVATDTTSDDVYTIHGFENTGTEVASYDSSGASLYPGFAPHGASSFTGVAVDASRDRIYLTDSNNEVEVWSIAGPEGPTNRADLTVTKSAGGSGGVGTVKSKPKGINCATACNEAVASFYKNSNVELSAKPATGSTFTEWTGACSGASPTCVVSMTEAKEVGAVFGGTSKAILSPTALSVSKGESSGQGTVKATGLYCEADCTDTTVLYQGTITEPKPKAAKTVELSQVPLYGSEFSGWSGCDSESEGKCIVTMSSAKEVTAEYTAKPNVALTLEKGGTGTGTVTSNPKGVKCAVTCTTQDMAVPSGEAVVLKAKAATGMTFTGWSGGGCSGAGETCTVNPVAATTVTASFSGSPKPIASPTALTLAKAGSGYGTVKAAGLTCEALCTSATSLFQGTVTEPKPKEAKIVILLATSAPGSQAVAWSGCDSEPEGNCQVQMSSAKEVTATFNELP